MKSFQEGEKQGGVDWGRWERRNKYLASLISPQVKSVMDLGAGAMLLKKFLPPDILYKPVDYTKRCRDTIICDFNKHQFPQSHVDAVIISGCLEYVEDVDWFFQQVSENAIREVILSYNVREDVPDLKRREESLWVNNLSFREVVRKFQDRGLILTHHSILYNSKPNLPPQWRIFKFEKKSVTTLMQYKLCTGCGCCANICPNDAIQMRTDKDGFLKPNRDSALCINCGLCVEKCPSINLKNKNTIAPENYACMANDSIREKSSNGGTFTLLAEEMIANGGIVFGAAWRNDFTVHHKAVRTSEALDLLRKSKYLQSDTEDTFRQVKKYLEEGTPVLYTGCPCQIAGLKSFLGKDEPLLLLVDVLCSHAPSPKVFRKYLDENYGLGNIKSFTFRDKSYGWNPTTQRIELKDGKVIYNDWNEDCLQKGFHPCLFMNDTCEQCFWCNLPRVGDLTIGDFWGIEQIDPLLNDRKGTATLLVNTAIGRAWFERIKSKYARCVSVPLDVHLSGQLSGRRSKHPNWTYFEHLLKRKTFNQAVECALTAHFDICLLAPWSSENYGTVITYYSLYAVLQRLGYETMLVERPDNAPMKPLAGVGLFQESPYPKYALQQPTLGKEDMRALADHCDTVMVGSDQLFRGMLYRAFGEIITLDWVPSYRRKIGYAISWGGTTIEGDWKEQATIAHYLQKFHAVSVREKSAVKVAKSRFGTEAEFVLDPVFLFGREGLSGLANNAEPLSSDGKQPYLFSYILDPDKKKADLIVKCAKSVGLEAVVVSDPTYSTNQVHMFWDDMPTKMNVAEEGWLRGFRDCQYVITDSFHGMCMAIIFQKPFVVLCNRVRGAGRFDSLLEMLGLENRMIQSWDDSNEALRILNIPIDFLRVESILKRERDRSLSWLEKSLQIPVDLRNITDSDICNDRIVDLQRRLNNFENILRALEQRTTGVEQRTAGVEQRTAGVEQRTAGLEQQSIGLEQRMVGLEQSSGIAMLRKLSPILDKIRWVKRKIW